MALALRLRSRPLEMAGPEAVLVLAPHPDDEAFGCGGTIPLLVARGIATHIAFLTDGSASHPAHPVFSGAEVAALRTGEARRAAAALGVAAGRVSFLGAPDGRLGRLEPEEARAIERRIAALVAAVGPARIFLPCRRDGSSEHEGAFVLVGRALALTPLRPRILEYPVWAWWNPRRLFGPLLHARTVWRSELGAAAAVKATAVASYHSQLAPLPPDPAAALPDGFASMFAGGCEYFFEQ
jgi:LmbE family N-acetylglucosaminyl deacetylase